MTTLRYAPGTKYAALGSVGFPTYPDRATAEAERARIVEACGDRGDIEIVESAPIRTSVRGKSVSAWENEASPTAGVSAPRPGSDHLSEQAERG